MKRLVPIPHDSLKVLKLEKDNGFGYKFVSVKLNDGRTFEQAIESEGCIIQVKGQKDIPFTEQEVESVQATSKKWNFRRRLRRLKLASESS
jgi:hypothetical protein